MIPYFRDLFSDLANRTQKVAAKGIDENIQMNNKVIDKTTFFDYCQLPGIICDRVFNLMADDRH